MSQTTIYTLADELKVSPSTVSRALSNSAKISEKRRREIKELAHKRGFNRRSFASRLTNLCVLMCTDREDEMVFSNYTDQIINGVNRYCVANELELSIFSSTIDKLNRIDLVKEFFRRDADGVIVVNADDRCTFFKQLEEEIPYCCLLSGNPDFAKHILTVDNRELALKGVNYLIQLGHRKILFLHSAPDNAAQRERFQGYRDALALAGHPLDLRLIPQPRPEAAASGIEFGYSQTAALLESEPGITAIFTASIDLADGAYAACHQRGLRIPEDISLLSCDNIRRTEYFCPALSVIDIPNARLAQIAAAWVHQKILGKAMEFPLSEPWMSGSILIRESTAKAPDRAD